MHTELCVPCDRCMRWCATLASARLPWLQRIHQTPAQQGFCPARQVERYSKLRGIITGVTPISLYLEFLSSHNHADRQARAWSGAEYCSPVPRRKRARLCTRTGLMYTICLVQ